MEEIVAFGLPFKGDSTSGDNGGKFKGQRYSFKEGQISEESTTATHLRDDDTRDSDGDSWNGKEKASSIYFVEIIKNR